MLSMFYVRSTSQLFAVCLTLLMLSPRRLTEVYLSSVIELQVSLVENWQI